MDTEESVSKAWNDGFEAGISFAKAMLESESNNPKPETVKHDFGCLIYVGCKCGQENN